MSVFYYHSCYECLLAEEDKGNTVHVIAAHFIAGAVLPAKLQQQDKAVQLYR